MSHKITLITDSTCDIPAEWRKQYDITVIPMTVIMNGKPCLDGVDISAEQFYTRLPKEPHHPTTSQPAPGVFLQAFQAAKDQGAREIIVITISSAMSGTILSARQAAEQADIPVHVVDSKTNSMGLGWQVVAAARAREAGGGADEMLAAVEKVRSRMVYYISLNTIEYLASGGRIADAARFLGSVLRIRPLIYVKPDKGTVGAAFPATSRRSAIEGLYREFFKRIDTSRPMHITVLHNMALEEAQALAERVKAEYSPKELFISYTSPVLGVHTGPLALALCGYAEL